jgi:hypothetical protein
MNQLLKQRCPNCDEGLMLIEYRGKFMVGPRRISMCIGYRPPASVIPRRICQGIGSSANEATAEFEKNARNRTP